MQLLGVAIAAAVPGGRVRAAQPAARPPLASAIGLAIAVGLIVFPASTWYGLPTDRHAARRPRCRRPGRRAGQDPGGAGGADRSAPPRRGRLALGGGVLGPRARLPRREPAPRTGPAGGARGLRRHGARGVREAALRCVVPGGRAARRVRGRARTGAGVGSRVVLGPAGGRRVRRPGGPPPRVDRAGRGLPRRRSWSPASAPRRSSTSGRRPSGRVAIDPFVSIQHALTQQTPVEVFRVTTRSPNTSGSCRFRTSTGCSGSPSTEEGAVVEAGDPAAGDAMTPSGLTEPVVIERHGRSGADAGCRRRTPSTSVAIPGRTVRFNPDTGTTFVDRPLEQGESYRVDGVGRAADRRTTFGSDAPPPRSRTAGTSTLPAGLDGGRRPRASMDEGRSPTTTSTRRCAIQEHLRNGSFTYTVDTSLHGGTTLDHRLPDGVQGGVLPAVLDRDGGHAADRSAVQSRVVVGFAIGDRIARDGAVLGQDGHRPQLGGGVLPGLGVDAVRADPHPGEPGDERLHGARRPTCTGRTCPGIRMTPATGGEAESVGPRRSKQRGRIESDPRLGNAAARPSRHRPP